MEPGCPNLARSTRCSVHVRARQRQRGSPTQRGYGAEYQRRRRALLEQWVADHGWVCPGYRERPHPARDLTADHVVPVAEGGRDGPLSVLCRRCNGRRGQETQRAAP